MSFFSKSAKSFVSEYDQLLGQFDKEHPKKTASEQAEIDKYADINQKRDTQTKQDKTSDIWSDF